MRVEADASDYMTGGVLLTKYKDGKWRPVAFISKYKNLQYFMTSQKLNHRQAK